jgi:hypothetical protein
MAIQLPCRSKAVSIFLTAPVNQIDNLALGNVATHRSAEQFAQLDIIIRVDRIQ